MAFSKIYLYLFTSYTNKFLTEFSLEDLEDFPEEEEPFDDTIMFRVGQGGRGEGGQEPFDDTIMFRVGQGGRGGGWVGTLRRHNHVQGRIYNSLGKTGVNHINREILKVKNIKNYQTFKKCSCNFFPLIHNLNITFAEEKSIQKQTNIILNELQKEILESRDLGNIYNSYETN